MICTGNYCIVLSNYFLHKYILVQTCEERMDFQDGKICQGSRLLENWIRRPHINECINICLDRPQCDGFIFDKGDKYVDCYFYSSCTVQVSPSINRNAYIKKRCRRR